MREPKLTLETDESQRAILVVECSECRNKSRFLLDQVTAGTSVLCNCGGVLNLTAKSLEAVRQQLDDV